MRLDAHPKSMGLLMVAVSLAGIGLILTIAFFSNTALLGVGIALAVLGAALSVLGLINLCAQEDKELSGDTPKHAGVAPPRIPPTPDTPDENPGPLEYEPCTATPSPPRDRSRDGGRVDPNAFGPSVQPSLSPPPPPVDGAFSPLPYSTDPATGAAGGIVPRGFVTRSVIDKGQAAPGAAAVPLSPFQDRRYPVPAQAGVVQADGGARPPQPPSQHATGYDATPGHRLDDVAIEIDTHRDMAVERRFYAEGRFADDDDALPEGYWSPQQGDSAPRPPPSI